MLAIIYQKLGIQVCNLKASYSNNFPKTFENSGINDFNKVGFKTAKFYGISQF